MRKLVGIVGLLVFLAVYAVIAALIGERIAGWHWAVKVVYYLVAGIAWALPLKPLMTWIHAKDPPLQSNDIS